MTESTEVIACIFDNDGTLVDSHPSYIGGADLVLGSFGLRLADVKDPFGQDFRGTSFLSIWQEAVYQHGIDMPYEEFGPRAEAESVKLMIKQDLPEDPGLVQLLEELALHDVPMAVASMSYRSRTESILSMKGLRPYFTHLVTGDDVPESRKKPDPYIFREAARRLGVPAVRCVVFEDAPIGIEGARRAGMKKIGVSNYGKNGDELAKADLVIDDYSQITYETLLGLFSS